MGKVSTKRISDDLEMDLKTLPKEWKLLAAHLRLKIITVLSPHLNYRYNYYLLFRIARSRNIQPAIRNNPPNGVTGPINLTASLFSIFKKVSK